jgi:hypothetical protein
MGLLGAPLHRTSRNRLAANLRQCFSLIDLALRLALTSRLALARVPAVENKNETGPRKAKGGEERR